MSQFESASAAALAQIKIEAISSSPVGNAVATSVGIGSKILDLAGFHGAGALGDLIQLLKGLAANKDEANLIYFGEALVDDIRRLYRMHEEMRRQVNDVLLSQGFQQTVANATLHVTRTNVDARIARVAILIANGVKARDLEIEGLDDMMRAAVELTEWDIFVLDRMCESQKQLLSGKNWSHDWTEQVGAIWANWNRTFGVGEDQHLRVRSALSRLQSLGLVAEAQTNFVKDGSLARQAFGLLPEGLKFFERLGKIE